MSHHHHRASHHRQHDCTQASAHPELADAIHDQQIEIASATRALRAQLADLTALADAATTICQTIIATEADRDRVQQRDHIAQHLADLRTALTTPGNQPGLADDAAAATTVAQFAATHLRPEAATRHPDSGAI